MTKQRAMQLSTGDEIYSISHSNHKQKLVRWRVSGKTRYWKRTDRFRIPLQHGLYTHSAVTQDNIDFFYDEAEASAIKL